MNKDCREELINVLKSKVERYEKINNYKEAKLKYIINYY